jgi:hypothetical protein
MKKGSIQLCFLLVAITAMHTMKIVKNSPLREYMSPVKKTKNVINIPAKDSLMASVANRRHFDRLPNPNENDLVLPDIPNLEGTSYNYFAAISFP